MTLFAVEYRYAASTIAARDETRPRHRGWLGELVTAGTVRSSGPYPDGSGALIILDTDTIDTAKRILAEDPFAIADLIEAVRVTEWQPVLGAFAPGG